MTQITLTHPVYPALTAIVMQTGITLDWSEYMENPRDITWEDMDDGEKLCQIFQDQRVAEFVVIAKFLAEVHQKRLVFLTCVQW